MTVTINNRTTVFQVNLFRLDTENVTLDNGVQTDVHVLRHPGAAAIVPFLDDDTLVLVKQYRHAIGGYIWEIPAGTLDAVDEAPLECAKRELIEETGYRGTNFEKLGTIVPAPGYSDERLHIFTASGLTPATQNLEADEVLKVHKVAFADAMTMIRTNDISDAKTIAGLHLAADFVRGF
ncbi:MAG: NUDIX hydrolase [Thermodesulfobacteriota bacterium]|nr:NUDIX hydrolase [Thermodesulfobacteriota bacterium]